MCLIVVYGAWYITISVQTAFVASLWHGNCNCFYSLTVLNYSNSYSFVHATGHGHAMVPQNSEYWITSQMGNHLYEVSYTNWLLLLLDIEICCVVHSSHAFFCLPPLKWTKIQISFSPFLVCICIFVCCWLEVKVTDHRSHQPAQKCQKCGALGQ